MHSGPVSYFPMDQACDFIYFINVCTHGLSFPIEFPPAMGISSKQEVMQQWSMVELQNGILVQLNIQMVS